MKKKAGFFLLRLAAVLAACVFALSGCPTDPMPDRSFPPGAWETGTVSGLFGDLTVEVYVTDAGAVHATRVRGRNETSSFIGRFLSKSTEGFVGKTFNQSVVAARTDNQFAQFLIDADSANPDPEATSGATVSKWALATAGQAAANNAPAFIKRRADESAKNDKPIQEIIAGTIMLDGDVPITTYILIERDENRNPVIKGGNVAHVENVKATEEERTGRSEIGNAIANKEVFAAVVEENGFVGSKVNQALETATAGLENTTAIKEAFKIAGSEAMILAQPLPEGHVRISGKGEIWALNRPTTDAHRIQLSVIFNENGDIERIEYIPLGAHFDSDTTGTYFGRWITKAPGTTRPNNWEDYRDLLQSMNAETVAKFTKPLSGNASNGNHGIGGFSSPDIVTGATETARNFISSVVDASQKFLKR